MAEVSRPEVTGKPHVEALELVFQEEVGSRSEQAPPVRNQGNTEPYTALLARRYSLDQSETDSIPVLACGSILHSLFRMTEFIDIENASMVTVDSVLTRQVQRRVSAGMVMVSTEWLEAEVLKAVPDADVEVIDLHRSGDHFHVRITSPSFEGMRPLKRQKQVLNHMKQFIPHPVHAIDLKCMTPEQAAVTGDTAFDPHAGGQGVHIRRINRQKEE